MYNRLLNLRDSTNRKSCLLLGPRQTGKSWLIKNTLNSQDTVIYNLLDNQIRRAFSANPSILREENAGSNKLIVIDEIQKIPELLDEVHLMIEECGSKFLLTGSSARKLRKSGTNLLGGRASKISFHPLCKKELGSKFNLNKALTYGTLPAIYNSEEPHKDLEDYVELYLKEEIAQETAIRQLPAFSRFLDIVAICNARIINYTEIGNDTQIAPSTIRSYFQVLSDTLLINRIPCWRESKKRKASAKDKFYFFDIGVARFLQGRKELISKTPDFGDSLETYIFHELQCYSSYINKEKISFWQTQNGQEVDFILSDHTAIEVKSTNNVTSKHLKGLRILMEEKAHKNYILVSKDPRPRSVSGIEILPVELFLEKLFNQEYQ